MPKPNLTFQRSFASFARAHYAQPAELCVRRCGMKVVCFGWLLSALMFGRFLVCFGFLLPACGLVWLVVRLGCVSAWQLAVVLPSVAAKQMRGFCSKSRFGSLRGFRLVVVLPLFLWSFSLLLGVLAAWYSLQINAG